MFGRLTCILLGLGLCAAPGPSRTSPPSGTAAYSLGFSTYLSHTDRFFPAFDVATDRSGNIYVSGNTTDRNFPTTQGAFQRDLEGEADAFVAKFTPAGTLVFSTLIGGSKREHHTGVTVDAEGYVYLVGGTHSPDFPVTRGAYDTTFNGEGEWAGDVYVAKLNPSGTAVVFATFIGGKAEDTASSIAVGPAGSVIIGGVTCSPDFPATDGVIDRTYTKQDSFIARFSPGGDRLLFSTSLAAGVQDTVTGLAVDDKDDIYAIGFTAAPGLPVTGTAIRRHLIQSKAGGFESGIDHFLAKIDGRGTKVLYLTYLAEGGYMAAGIRWARPNRLMAFGSTNAEMFPVTGNALSTKGRGERDAFLSIFDSDSMTLQYSTLFGGSQLDTVSGARFLDPDRVAIAGITNSADFPLTDGAIDSVYPVSDKLFNSSFLGRRKAFVSIVNVRTGELMYSTFMGACLRFDIDSDSSGNLAFVAETGPQGFPGTTEFPLSDAAFQAPPTNIMVGRLALSDTAAAVTRRGPS